MAFLKRHKGIVAAAIFFLLGFSFLFSQQDGSITLNNPKVRDAKKIGLSENKELLANLAGGEPKEDGVNAAKGLFLDQRQIPTQGRQAIISYIAKTNNAIPLNTEALRFALTEAILGQYSPLTDAVGRLQEGRDSISLIAPPLDAITFHSASLYLLDEYVRVLRVPLSVPRDQFEPAQLEDDFKKLDALVMVAKHELRLLMNAYGVPLLPKVILFYDEAIGID